MLVIEYWRNYLTIPKVPQSLNFADGQMTNQ